MDDGGVSAGARRSPAALASDMPAWAVLVAAMCSFQLGAAIASHLVGDVGAPGAAFCRNALGGLMLLAVQRPRLRGRTRGELADVVALGLLLSVLNTSFYLALARLPLGVTVTVQFLGPLGVALAGSRHRRDLAWVALAASGIALFGDVGGKSALDHAGLAFAALSGAAWAAYALLAKRVGRRFPGATGLAVAFLISALTLAPFGAAAAPKLATPDVATLALGVGAFSTALPHSLELAALRRLRAATYGILVSLEPALATAFGLVILGQRPSLRELLAVALVVTASAGAARSARTA